MALNRYPCQKPWSGSRLLFLNLEGPSSLPILPFPLNFTSVSLHSHCHYSNCSHHPIFDFGNSFIQLFFFFKYVYFCIVQNWKVTRRVLTVKRKSPSHTISHLFHGMQPLIKGILGNFLFQHIQKHIPLYFSLPHKCGHIVYKSLKYFVNFTVCYMKMWIVSIMNCLGFDSFSFK